MLIDDFSKMRVPALRRLLMNKFNYTVKEVDKIKGKKELVAEYKKVANLTSLVEDQSDIVDDDDSVDDFEDVEEVKDDIPFISGIQMAEEQEQEQEEVQLSPSSPDWTNHVLSLLGEKEKIDGNPTTNGLRRIAPLLLGKIISSDCNVVQAPCPQNSMCVVIQHTLTFEDGSIVSSVADATPENMPPEPYDKYYTAMADSRAEGRCYRRALKLNIVTADELRNTKSGEPDQHEGEPDSITDVQIQAMDVSGKRYNINLAEFIKQEGVEAEQVKKIKYEEALVLQEKLMEYNINSDNIPEKLLGYNTEWKN